MDRILPKLLNYYKTKELCICFKRTPPDSPLLTTNDRPIEQTNSTRLLGVTITVDFKWHPHIDKITAKASQCLYFVIPLNRAGVDSHHIIKIYTTLVRSIVEYACQVCHNSQTSDETARKHPETSNAHNFFKCVSRQSNHHSENTNAGRPEGDPVQNSIYEHATFLSQAVKQHT